MKRPVREIIGGLNSLGYILYVDHEKVLFRYTPPGEPPKDEADALLAEARKQKEEIRDYLKEMPQGGIFHKNPFKMLFDSAVKCINDHYIAGTIEYIRENHPDIDRKIDEAAVRVENIWLAGLQGTATLNEFRTAVEEWSGLELEAVRIYSKARESQ